MASFKVVMVVLMYLSMMGAPMIQATITCGQVTSSLAQCIPYLQGKGPPSVGCCNGVKGLAAAAKTTADKQAACKCLKSAYTSIPSINQGNAASLPGKCGVSIPYKISPSTNCDTIKF